MLNLFKVANRNLRQFGGIATAARIENAGIQNSFPDLISRCFASTRARSLDKKKRVEDALDKFENDDFGIDWDKFTSYNKQTSQEFLEEMGKEFEESTMTSEQKAERETEQLKQRLGSNYSKYKRRFYQEKHPGFKDEHAPLPRKANLYDSANESRIPKSHDYTVSNDDFSKSLSEMTYLDHITGRFQKDWDREFQDLQHYNQLLPEMKNEDYLKGKPSNFLVIHNIPKSASKISLLNLVRGFGEVKQFQIRENLFGENAFIEVHYANVNDASKAKKELHRKKFQGSSLYPMNFEDAATEHPSRRTLAVYNLNPSWNEQKTIYELSKFGNVMDIQLPVKFIHRKLPTRAEVIKALERLNLAPEERARVRIKEYIYDVKKFGWVSFEEKVHVLPDLELGSEKVNDNYDTMQQTNIQDSYERAVNKFKIQHDKFYLEEIAGAFPVYYCCADYSNIQHLLQAPSHDSGFSPEQELLRLSYTEREILAFQQELFKVEQGNRGYCFVTFASEDDAKRALIDFTYRPLVNEHLEGTLKLDTNHVDWDVEKFHEFMDAYDIKTTLNKEKLLAESQKLKEKQEIVEIKEKFHKYALNNEVEKVYYDTQVPKVDLKETELSPAELRGKYTRRQKHFERNLRDNALYQTVKDELFTESENPAVNFDEAELSANTLQVGRNLSRRVTQSDYLNLMNKLEESANKSGKELTETAREYFDELDKLSDKRVLDDLLAANLALSQLEKSPSSSSIEHINQKIEQLKEVKVKNPAMEKFVDDLINVYPGKAMDKEVEYEEYLKRKAIRSEKDRRRRRTLFGQGRAKFSTVKELESVEAAKNISREEVTKRALKKFEEIAGKIHTGKLTEGDFEELYRPRLENLQTQVSQDPHFLVRDSRGLQFVTEQDLKRFEEDQAPEDPVQLEKFREGIRKLKLAKVRRDKDREDRIKNSAVERTVLAGAITIAKKGIPLETFEFKPSAEYPTIDDYIKQLNKLDEVFTYVKDKDENGKEVILKVFKKKYKYDLDHLLALDPSTLTDSLKGILEAKGVQVLHSESDDPVWETFERIASEKNPSPSEQAALEAVQDQFPEIAESLLTGNAIGDIDRFIEEIIEQIQYMRLEDETRALTKEDLVKYRSLLLNIKDENGRITKSKYSKI